MRAISRMAREEATGLMRSRWIFGKERTRQTTKMPDEWWWSTMVPLYKNKGDIQNCNNYRGIKLLSHTMKIWERVVEMRETSEHFPIEMGCIEDPFLALFICFDDG
ncbi:hypothetical protein H5410_018093 [Solanum commersonii]|uniref:Uncharacterized protein n=1 Tax=Solanum commersonii TaxID=4109 RepID=A0A9J6A117_SOLCO|nr:hypothetical protein H5410_018093 [Solanum commersonii]